MYCLCNPCIVHEVCCFFRREHWWINGLKSQLIWRFFFIWWIRQNWRFKPAPFSIPLCVPLSRNRKHNQILTFNLSPSPLVLCHMSHLSSTFPSPILAEPQPVQCFPLQCFYLTYPQALSVSLLSLFPPPVSGHWLLYMDFMMKCHSPT